MNDRAMSGSCRHVRLRHAVSLALGTSAAFAGGGAAAGEVVFDGTLGAPGAIFGPAFLVPQDRGTTSSNGVNLFHSFDRFNVDFNESVRFTGDAGIQNVIARVTGGDSSTIDGTIDTITSLPEASFWFVNPAGVIVNANARFDVGGAIALGAADSIRFGEQVEWLVADRTNLPSQLTVNPLDFGFVDNSAAGGISVADATITTTSQDVRIVAHSNVLISGSRIITSGGTFGGGSLLLQGSGVTVSNSNLETDGGTLGGPGAGALVLRATGSAPDHQPSLVGSEPSAGVVRVDNSRLSARNGEGHNTDRDPSKPINRGDLVLEGDHVVITDAQLLKDTLGDGTSEPIQITADRGVWILGQPDQLTLLSAQGAPFSPNLNQILIRAGSSGITIRDAELRTETIGRPQDVPGASMISLDAWRDEASNGAVTLENAYLRTTNRGGFRGGDINIEGASIAISGGQVSAASEEAAGSVGNEGSSGDAGSITLHARGAVGAVLPDGTALPALLIDDGAQLRSDATTARVLPAQDGASLSFADAGSIELRADRGSISIGGSSTLVTSAGPDAHAAGAITISGAGLELNSATIKTTVETLQTGATDPSGQSRVFAPAAISLSSTGDVTLTDSLLDARTSGAVRAGSISIAGGQVHISGGRLPEPFGAGQAPLATNTAVITSTSGSGAGGDISVRATASAAPPGGVGSTGLLSIRGATLSGQSDHGGAAGDLIVAGTGVLIAGQSTIQADFQSDGGVDGAGPGSIVIRAHGTSGQAPAIDAQDAAPGVVRIVDSAVTANNVGGRDQSGRGNITIGAAPVDDPDDADDLLTDHVVIAGSVIRTDVEAQGLGDDILINGAQGVWIAASGSGGYGGLVQDDPRATSDRSLVSARTGTSAAESGQIQIRGGALGVNIQNSHVDTSNAQQAAAVDAEPSRIGVDSAGRVTLTGAVLNSDTTGVVRAGDIEITGGSVHIHGGQVTAATAADPLESGLSAAGDAGSVLITANGADVNGAPALLIDTAARIASEANQASSTVDEAGRPIDIPDAGLIRLLARNGTSRLEGGAVLSTATGPNAGAAGDIEIAASAVGIADASLRAATQGSGDAGRVAVTASGANGVRISGRSVLSSDASQARSVVDSAGVLRLANAGSVDVRADQASVTVLGDESEGVLISSSAGADAGQAGSVSLQGTSGVEVGRITISTSVATARTSGAEVDGEAQPLDPASIALSSANGSVILADSLLDARTTGAVSAGSVQVQGTNVTIRGGRLPTTSEAVAGNTAITTSTTSTGLGGDITVVGNAVLVEDATLSSQTGGSGAAGSICIAAGNAACASSAAGVRVAQAQAALPGAGGLTLDSSALSTSTFGTGAAGQITVNALSELLLVNGASIQSTSSSPDATAGAAGSIKASGGSISISNSEISAVLQGGSEGTAPADVTLISGAGGIELLEGARITTDAAVADAGQISLSLDGGALLMRDAQISASAGGIGDGANVIVDEVGTMIMQRSRISAQAVSGNGGQINLFVEDLIRDTHSVIDASSELGNDGEVTISSPDVDLNGAIQPQKVNISNTPELSQSACASSEAARSTFASEGKGGFTQNPDGYLTSVRPDGPKVVASTAHSRDLRASESVRGCQ